VLAYVFWHVAAPGADDYEQHLAAFHDMVGVPSAWFAVPALPWMPGPGYEDWYLVDDWTALGVLNDAAPQVLGHDVVAQASADGTGAVYRLTGGTPDLGAVAGATWSDEPVAGDVTWRRQLVLGPAPQYCSHHRSGGAVARTVVAPPGRRP
jgi:hypothetical protein